MPEKPQVLHLDLMSIRPPSSMASAWSKHALFGSDMIKLYSSAPEYVCAK
jgi:hypothetical protein